MFESKRFVENDKTVAADVGISLMFERNSFIINKFSNVQRFPGCLDRRVSSTLKKRTSDNAPEREHGKDEFIPCWRHRKLGIG